MKKIYLIILCITLMLAFAGCGFKNAESAKASMHDVNQSAEGLKEETESSREKTEELKEQETNDSVQGHQW
ncbi:hypothetical protein [Maridesulfovibrio sp.]|uniref:hypothetical protein n=1 Tax=Maridesulfovibrio sp. TaxID=2795000 RepID=UPI002A189BD2|nr:hypothetical protein [Maridesulfovibrio sp.]